MLRERGWKGRGGIKPEQIAGVLTPPLAFDLSQQFLCNCKSSPGHTARLGGVYLSQSFQGTQAWPWQVPTTFLSAVVQL